MNIKTTALALSLALLGGAAGAQTSSTAADEAAIKEARRIQTEALAKNDLDTVVKYLPARGGVGHGQRQLLRQRRLQGGCTSLSAAGSDWPDYAPTRIFSASSTRFMCARESSATGLSPMNRWLAMVRIWSMSKSVSVLALPSLPTGTRRG